MLTLLKTFFGLGSGISLWAYAVVFGIGLAAGAGGTWRVMQWDLNGKEAQLSGKDTALKAVTADRDAQAKAVKVGQGIITGMQAQWDEADAQAKATIAAGEQKAVQLAADLQTTSDQRESYLQQLKEAGHARPIVVSQVVKDGWDPVIVDGMRRLKCVQLAALAGPNGVPAADCRVQAQNGATGPNVAADPAGAGDYRPTFDQQLQLLSDTWRLRDWGASCYADKRAIAASQAAQ